MVRIDPHAEHLCPREADSRHMFAAFRNGDQRPGGRVHIVGDHVNMFGGSVFAVLHRYGELLHIEFAVREERDAADVRVVAEIPSPALHVIADSRIGRRRQHPLELNRIG